MKSREIRILKKELSIDGGYTPLHLLARHYVDYHAEYLTLLLDRGASIRARSETLEETALHLAVSQGTVDSISILLDRGADIDAQDTDGETPLHAAVQDAYMEEATLLLDRGANIEAQRNDGKRPFQLAVEQGDNMIFTLLRDRGANTNAIVSNDDENGGAKTALQIAAYLGHADIMTTLLGSSSPPSSSDRKAARQLAEQNNHSECLSILDVAGPMFDIKFEMEYTSKRMVRKKMGSDPLYTVSFFFHSNKHH